MTIVVADSSTFDAVRAPATADDASQAVFLECFQTLANRTRYLLDALSVANAPLAANQVRGRASAGVEEGKSCTDQSFALLALDTPVAWFDALSTKGTDVASATTIDLAAVTGRYVVITGNTDIANFGSAPAGVRRHVRFAGSLTLLYGLSTLLLPGGENISTAAGDTLEVVSEGSGVWRVTQYQRADGGVTASQFRSIGDTFTYAASRDLDVGANNNHRMSNALAGDMALTLLNGQEGDAGAILIKQGTGGAEHKITSISAAGRTTQMHATSQGKVNTAELLTDDAFSALLYSFDTVAGSALLFVSTVSFVAAAY